MTGVQTCALPIYGQEISKGDLLIVNNNVSIPDFTGFNQPRKIVNGSSLLINEVIDRRLFTISVKHLNQPVNLAFIKLKVNCLSISSKPDTEIWILENYFNNDDDLSKEESIAFRIFINQKVLEERKNSPFIDSKEFVMLLENELFISLLKEEQEAIKKIAKNYDLPKEAKFSVKPTPNA